MAALAAPSRQSGGAFVTAKDAADEYDPGYGGYGGYDYGYDGGYGGDGYYGGNGGDAGFGGDSGYGGNTTDNPFIMSDDPYGVAVTASDAPRRHHHRSGSRSRSKPRRRRHSSSADATSTTSIRDLQRKVDAMPTPSVADVAASSLELWSGLGRARGGPQLVASRPASEAEREVAALRLQLLEERKRIKKELRSLKVGWEKADHRASSLEQELLVVRCAQNTLTKEVGAADVLSGWWRGRYVSAQREVETQMAAVQGCNSRVEALSQELERSKLQVRELEQAVALHDAGRDHLRKRIAEKDAQLEAASWQAEQQLKEADERRTTEYAAHKQRVGKVSERLEHFLDQVRSPPRSPHDLLESARNLLAICSQSARNLLAICSQSARHLLPLSPTLFAALPRSPPSCSCAASASTSTSGLAPRRLTSDSRPT